jgi:Dihydroprymidine dehydrogenase domain II, 4Fe-4S cluster
MTERGDLTPLPDLLHGRSRSGPVRERRPVYVDLLPPCNAGCPAGENIQAWLAHAEVGRHEQAWRQLVADNPMPAIHGRVCYHPCESVCNRASLDSAVSIHSVERSLATSHLSGGGPSTRRQSAAVSAYSSSAPARAGFPPLTTWPGSAMRSR